MTSTPPKDLTAKQAAEALNIQLATLYSYVSRGLLRSTESDKKTKAKHYALADIEKLKQRQMLKKSPDVAVKDAMYWGSPIVESHISTIKNEQLYYRQQPIEILCRNQNFEAIVELLWQTQNIAINLKGIKSKAWSDTFICSAQSALLKAMASDPRAAQLSPTRTTITGLNILKVLLVLICQNGTEQSIAANLATTWQNPDATACIDKALILCADHELNNSAFTARCIASTNANLYQVIIGALASFSGSKHGGSLLKIEKLWQQFAMTKNIEALLIEQLQQSYDNPGFYHPLYPNGDPRAKLLLQAIQEQATTTSQQKTLDTVLNFFAADGLHPTIDFALIAMQYCLNLPQGAAQQLFVLARTAGWVAHAKAQYQTGKLIRPRSQ